MISGITTYNKSFIKKHEVLSDIIAILEVQNATS